MKKYEEFYTEEENYFLDNYISLGYILPRKSSFLIKSLEKDFLNVFNNIKSNKKDVINVINKYLPTFDHIEKGKHLDQRM